MKWLVFLTLCSICSTGTKAADKSYEIIRVCMQSDNYERCKQEFDFYSKSNKGRPMRIKVTPYKKN